MAVSSHSLARRTQLHLRHFTVLALESSADDTCAAAVTSSGRILSNVVLKQNHVYVPFNSALPKSSPEILYRHEPFGGIHPYRAVQAHQRNMVRSSSPRVTSRWSLKLIGQPIAVRRALKDACISATDVDGIAFTRGPGQYLLSSFQCLSCPPRLWSRYDRLSWRWFQCSKDACGGTKQAASWRTPHGTLPLFLAFYP